MKTPGLSVIVPAYNEVRLIEGTVRSLLRARAALEGKSGAECEVIVVDNGSDDGTRQVLSGFERRGEIVVHECLRRGAARARNEGAAVARGRFLVFVDADTWVDRDALTHVEEHLVGGRHSAGIAHLERLDGGLRAFCWWLFWANVRHLPLSKAKAMPALMFCSKAAFEELGPFDEEVGIGEEWPILAGAHRQDPLSVVYERRIRGRTSSRRMELQRLGYVRTLMKWVWAVASLRGRTNYSAHIR